MCIKYINAAISIVAFLLNAHNCFIKAYFKMYHRFIS
jgi:hypothetical protein